MIKIPYRTVVDLLKVGKEAWLGKKVIYKSVRTKLNWEHISYLTNPVTL